MSRTTMYAKLSKVQERLMEKEISSLCLEDLLPLIFKECLKENLVFYFNFVENACVLNLRDKSIDNLELNIRLYYSDNTVSDKESTLLKEQVLCNAFLLTSQPNASSANTKGEEKQIQESNIVPPRAIRAAMDTLTEKGETITRKNLEKELQLNKMSTDNRRQCIAYLRDMEE